MKISKLFHWLYAILMLLPILVFIPNAFYYGFNEHAVAQEKTELVPTYYKSNVINTTYDFVVGNVYSWNNNLTPIQNPSFTSFFGVTMKSSEYSNMVGTIYLDSPSGNLYFTDNNNYININLKQCDFVIDSLKGGIHSMPSEILDRFSICTNLYLDGNSEPVTTNMSITDSMSYAWDSTWQNDLFSWSYSSFLTQPFLYITNLFNVPPTNTLLYCLSYWLNISIIWLVFDLIMYVPLLVHRWIDKGIVE